MAAHQTPEYLVVGHIAVDLLPDGSPILGGTALYAALTAARFGLRTAVITRGNFTKHGNDITDALHRFAEDIEIIVQSSQQPTVFTNTSTAGRRVQTIHSWAGRIDLTGIPASWRSATIVHLAPIAQEIEARQAGRLTPEFLGVTPQGWMRHWPPSHHGTVTLGPLRLPTEVLSRVDAMVLNDEEQALARDQIEAVAARGLVAITRGSLPAQIFDRGRMIEVPSFPSRSVDDTGAGDVFAAALFVMRAEHESILAAGRMAAAAAGLRIRRQGPDAVPTRDEVEEFLESHPARTGRRARTY